MSENDHAGSDVESNRQCDFGSFDADFEKEETKKYLTAKLGSLPLVLSVPHGGITKPDFETHEGIQLMDCNTKQLAKKLVEELRVLLGCEPYLLINELHRSYLDPNREESKRACTENTKSAWRAYHEKLQDICQEARKHSEKNATLLLDIHGWKEKEHPYIQVGHVVTKKALQNTPYKDLTLPNSDLLVLKEGTHGGQWIRGQESSLGSLLCKNGLAAKPASDCDECKQKLEHDVGDLRAPGEPSVDGLYFKGGFITQQHRKEGEVFTIQLEFPKSYRDNHEDTAKKVAAAVCQFMKHWGFVSKSKEDHTSTAKFESMEESNS